MHHCCPSCHWHRHLLDHRCPPRCSLEPSASRCSGRENATTSAEKRNPVEMPQLPSLAFGKPGYSGAADMHPPKFGWGGIPVDAVSVDAQLGFTVHGKSRGDQDEYKGTSP